MNKYVKRALAWICTLTLVLSLSTVFASAAEAEREEPTRTVDPQRDYLLPYAANLRSGAGTNYATLRTVPAGYRVRGVLSGNSGWTYSSSTWTKVTYIDTGYMRNDLIIPLNKSYVVTTNSTLNLRAYAGNGEVIKSLANGTKLCKLGETLYNDVVWYYVRAYLDGERVTGYVHSGYVGVEYGA